ncbi:endonuclease III domain-containing protein [Thiorhodococcus fuscus]|uniref:Endonuclease III domain-containing protein n=1 Tax=Thiorhodococcus fuscus TaxID=527200 RepID=A0ABW4YCU7_9GAMM
MHAVYSNLLAVYGRQGWWPADTPFEVMVGAVLTQNTAWTNVERALERLAERIDLSAEAILALDAETLADAVRPAGYFNLKARRLRDFCDFYVASGGLDALSRIATDTLRAQLLAVKGIGPETADDMLLYAFDRPVFVVDAYTRRLFSRLGQLAGDEGYEGVRAAFEAVLGPDVSVLKEYHALLVRHAKEACRSRPRCSACSLRPDCPAGLDAFPLTQGD